MGRLNDKKVAFLATDGVEQVELTEPWKKVEEEGGTPELVSLDDGEIQGFDHLDKGDTFEVDEKVADASESDYYALVLPGGVANPDFLRGDDDAVAFVRSFFEAKKPVAVICHGPWTLVEADVVRDRTITVMADAGDRHPQRGWRLGRRGGRRGQRPRVEPEAGRPAGLLREDGRGDLRGQARGAGRRDPLSAHCGPVQSE